MATTSTPPAGSRTFEDFLKQIQGDRYVTSEERQKIAQKASDEKAGKSGGGNPAAALGTGIATLGLSAYLQGKIKAYFAGQKTDAGAGSKPTGASSSSNTNTPASTNVPSSSAPLANSGLTQAGNESWNAGANAAQPKPIGQKPDGTIMMDDGSTANPNTGQATNAQGQPIPATQSPYLSGLQIAGGLAQGYSGYKQYQDGQKLGGAANMMGGAYNAYVGGSALANGGAAGAGAQYARPVGNAVAAAQIGQNMISQEGASADRAAASKTEALKAALNYIPVYGQLAYLALAGVDAVSGGKGTQTWTAANKSLDRFNNKVDFGLQRAVDAKLFHQSTKGTQMMHTGQLAERAPDDEQYMNYLGAMRSQVKDGPPDPTKPFAGKYATWDDYKKGGLEASDLTGVYGNINVYGPEWAKLDQGQREAVTQANINSDLYNSKKGDVYITDRDVAKSNYDNVLKNYVAKTPLAPPSSTSPYQRQSPGIYTDQSGKPIIADFNQKPLGGWGTDTTAPGVAPITPGQTPQHYAQAALGSYGAPKPVLPPRSNTLRPGIDMNGRRITYGR